MFWQTTDDSSDTDVQIRGLREQPSRGHDLDWARCSIAASLQFALAYCKPRLRFLQESVPASEVQRAVGPALFQANDFVIFQKLGSLNVRNIQAGAVGTAPEDTGASTRVNVFAATYESGKPFQGPVTVLLKEFVPGSRGVGLNELRLLSLVNVRCCTGTSERAMGAVMPCVWLC